MPRYDSFEKIKQDFRRMRDSGINHEQAIQDIIDNAPKDYRTPREINMPKDGFFKRLIEDLKLRETFQGDTKVGQIAGIGLDVLGLIVPTVGSIRNKSKKLLSLHKPQTKTNNMKWLKNRLKERTTWQGIVSVLTAVGVSLSPDQKEAIITAGAALVTVIWVFVKEPQSEDAKK